MYDSPVDARRPALPRLATCRIWSWLSLPLIHENTTVWDSSLPGLHAHETAFSYMRSCSRILALPVSPSIMYNNPATAPLYSGSRPANFGQAELTSHV